MGIFGSVSGKQVDEFAKMLARDLAEQCPPERGGSGRPMVSAKQLGSTLDDLCRRAVGYKNEHKLGIYKKARLGNTFRWELTELGFDKRFAEEATQRLVVQISRRDR